MSRGIYLVANRHSQREAAQLVSSLRLAGCTLPIVLIPFDDDAPTHPRLAAETTRMDPAAFPDEGLRAAPPDCRALALEPGRALPPPARVVGAVRRIHLRRQRHRRAGRLDPLLRLSRRQPFPPRRSRGEDRRQVRLRAAGKSGRGVRPARARLALHHRPLRLAPQSRRSPPRSSRPSSGCARTPAWRGRSTARSSISPCSSAGCASAISARRRTTFPARGQAITATRSSSSRPSSAASRSSSSTIPAARPTATSRSTILTFSDATDAERMRHFLRAAAARWSGWHYWKNRALPGLKRRLRR